MDRKKIVLFVLGFVMCVLISTAVGQKSSTGLTVSKEEVGVIAVSQSPGWSLLGKHDDESTAERYCQSAIRQGRKNYSEDRTFCTLDIHVPFPGPNGIRDTLVGIVAVFDGHNGAEASETASKLLLEYFTLHSNFLLHDTFSSFSKIPMGMEMLGGTTGENGNASRVHILDEKHGEHVLHIRRTEFPSSTIFDEAFRLDILKESLLRAIKTIDAKFAEEASRSGYNSGSTATVILMADGQLLVANIGDSKAFLCSEIFQSPPEAKATLLRLYRKRRSYGASVRMKDFKLAASASDSDGFPHFSAKELTKDHHPDRADERSRIESFGGFVSEWAGVSRVNGQLAVSRAIGDVSFKRFGVISVPEVTDWQPMISNDSYLVAISDGVVERLSPQDVCDTLWELHTHQPLGLVDTSSCTSNSSLADCIVDTAFEKGSRDNLAAVVVPLKLETETLPDEKSIQVRLQTTEQPDSQNADSTDCQILKETERPCPKGEGSSVVAEFVSYDSEA